MAIIAGGFLAGSVLNVLHIASTSTYPFDILTVENIYRHPELLYVLAGQIILSVAIFIAVFYTVHPVNKLTPDFRQKTYIFFFFITLLVIVLDTLINLDLLKTSKLIILEQSLGIIDQAFYLLTAFIYADMRIVQRKKLLSKFTVGLLILAVGQIFYINPLLVPAYEILAHVIKIFGFALIFAGIEELESSTGLIGFRQKLLAYLSLFLIISYLLFVSFASAIFNIQFPLYAFYLFLEFLIISIIIQYILTIRFISPVTNIAQVMNKYKIGEKPEKIPVISDDEVGMLTIKLNEVLDLVWKYNQELISRQTQLQQSRDKERILKEIITELKLSESLEQAYNFILSKIVDIFNGDRAVFIELPINNELIPTIKYEYLGSSDVQSIF